MQVKVVEFDYDDKLVVARVHLGTTPARGDDPDVVVSLNMEGRAYLDKALTYRLEELAIEHAKGYA